MYIDNGVIGILYVHRYDKAPHYDAWKDDGEFFVNLGRWEVIWTPPSARRAYELRWQREHEEWEKECLAEA